MSLNSQSVGEINFFRGENFIFSNFYENIDYPFNFNELSFISGEAAFQSAKSLNKDIQKKFCYLHPCEAKIYGRQVILRPNWEDIKDEIMYEVVRAKFSSHPNLRQRLIGTYPKILIEGNTWHDNHFGVCKCNRCKNKQKENILGKTLMRIREEMIFGEY